MPTILIATIRNDIHAEAIRHELLKNRDIGVVLLETDRLSADCTITWTPNGSAIGIPRGVDLEFSDIDLIWWRRTASEQLMEVRYDDPSVIDLINRDWSTTLLGAALTSFKGKWISHPRATVNAANKIVQLQVAQRCGFRIPRTLISNNPLAVRNFIRDVGRVVVKPVLGTKHALLFTHFVTNPDITDEAILACPAIYQEYIEGREHIRLNCFGEYSSAALISTDELDWRTNKNCTYLQYAVPPDIYRMVRAALESLELEMGIVDLKIDKSGEVCWLEVNPQGQFLFVEGLTGQRLREMFADYLVRESLRSRDKKTVSHE